MKCLIIVILLLMPCLSYAATGDILATSLITTDPGTDTKRVIVTGTANGCYSNTGTCVKVDAYDTDQSRDEAYWNIDFTDSSEVTVVWYEKYSVWPIDWGEGGGIKSMRPYYGTNVAADYIGALMTYHTAHNYSYGGIYMSAFGTATFALTDYITAYNNYDCTGDGTGGVKSIVCTTRFGAAWSTDGGTTNGMGTAWRKMRQWIKMPTSDSSADGESKLWIDDKLIYSITNLDKNAGGTTTINNIDFAPEDTSGTVHEHWYDDITVYEGYVPPGDAPSPSTGSLRSGVSASGVTFR